MTGPLSLAVVDAVAKAEGVEPTDLPTPLATAIDPDALNAVFRDGTGRLSFDYHGYRVTVDQEGAVEVAPHPETADSPERSSSAD